MRHTHLFCTDKLFSKSTTWFHVKQIIHCSDRHHHFVPKLRIHEIRGSQGAAYEIFWDMISYILADVYEHFYGTCFMANTLLPQ